MSINYGILPEFLREEARAYIEKGAPPGELMTAVICNDLAATLEVVREMEATDSRFEGFDAMADVEQFFRTEAPEGCWGSKGSLGDWVVLTGDADGSR